MKGEISLDSLYTKPIPISEPSASDDYGDDNTPKIDLPKETEVETLPPYEFPSSLEEKMDTF